MNKILHCVFCDMFYDIKDAIQGCRMCPDCYEEEKRLQEGDKLNK